MTDSSRTFARFLGILLSFSAVSAPAATSDRDQNVRTLEKTGFCFVKGRNFRRVPGNIQDHPIASKSKKVRCAVRIESRDHVKACPSDPNAPSESFAFGKDAITPDFVRYKAVTRSWVGGKDPGIAGASLKQLIINVNDPTVRAFICTAKDSRFDVREMTAGDLADALAGTVRLDAAPGPRALPSSRPRDVSGPAAAAAGAAANAIGN